MFVLQERHARTWHTVAVANDRYRLLVLDQQRRFRACRVIEMTDDGPVLFRAAPGFSKDVDVSNIQVYGSPFPRDPRERAVLERRPVPPERDAEIAAIMELV
jgi:hypothetical protein